MAYSGSVVTVPLGQAGLITDIAPGLIPSNALIDANNIIITDGVIEKIGGSQKWNSSALSAGVVSVFDWHPTNVKQRLMAATSDGKIYRDIGDRMFSGGVAIHTGLGPITPNSMFVEGGGEVALAKKKLFFFTNGLNQVQVLEGDDASFTEISSPATDWTVGNYPTVGLVHRNRLWAFQGQRAYASNTGDHEDFTTGFLTQNIFPGEGGDITGAFVFRGRLFAFKDGNFTYFLDDSASSSANWVWKKLASGFSLSAPNAVVEGMNDMLAGNSSGSITSYMATEKLGELDLGDVLAQNKVKRFVRENSSLRGAKYQHALYYPEKQQAYFTMRRSSQTSNDRFLILDASGGQPKITFSDKDNPQCLGLRKDIHGVSKPIYGDSNGYVYLMDKEDRDVGGVAYEGSFRTPHIDFGQLSPDVANKNKIFDWMSVEFTPEGSHNLSADIYIDGKFSETITFAMANRDDLLDNFVLDQDKTYGGEGQTAPNRPLHGSGRRISIKFYNAGLRESFRVTSFTIGFRVTGENPTRI